MSKDWICPSCKMIITEEEIKQGLFIGICPWCDTLDPVFYEAHKNENSSIIKLKPTSNAERCTVCGRPISLCICPK
jgi:hypothetical protein